MRFVVYRCVKFLLDMSCWACLIKCSLDGKWFSCWFKVIFWAAFPWYHRWLLLTFPSTLVQATRSRHYNLMGKLLLVLFGVFFGMLIVLTRNWDAFWVSSAKISLIESSFTPYVLRTFFFFRVLCSTFIFGLLSCIWDWEKCRFCANYCSLDWTPFLSLSLVSVF